MFANLFKSSRTVAALVACFALAACQSASHTSAPDDGANPRWPAAPEAPRYVFEATLRAASDIYVEEPGDGLRRLIAGERASTHPAFEKPTAVAARHGRVYVTDTVKRLVVVFDIPRRRVFYFGFRPPGALAKPIALALDSAQNVYVADASLRKVMMYDSLGLFIRAIGEPGDLERPTGVAVNPAGDRVYVIDRASGESTRHRVIVYDGAGNKVQEIGTRGTAAGRFNVPVQAVVGPDGNLYVLDAGNFRVQVFDAAGGFLRAFGSVGAAPGQFARPRGVAVDGEGNLYVSDAAFGNVQVFNTNGELLISIGSLGNTDRPGRYLLPIGVSVDETGRLYVVDQYFNKVEVIRRLSENERLEYASRAAHEPGK